MIDLNRFICSFLENTQLTQLKEEIEHSLEVQGLEYKDSQIVESKSKFKVGDWIKHNNLNFKTIKITNITNGNYHYKDIDGYAWYYPIKECDKNYHIWTIRDAKDADILFTKKGSIFIYKGIFFDKPYAYCGVDQFGVFKNCSRHGYSWTSYIEDLYPATKEQRDHLFSKMKEAGYMWDEKNKKLTEIKQWKPTDEQISALMEARYNSEGKSYHSALAKLHSDLMFLKDS